MKPPTAPVQSPNSRRGQSAVDAAKESFIPLMRTLARAYQAFDRYSSAHVRKLGLTPSQFDVIVTLGNTRGMPMYKLGEETLTTKGTLTGIIDRLEEKGLVHRQVRSEDRRCFNVVLTPKGARLFEAIFPAHIAHLKARFGRMNETERERLRRDLERLEQRFT
ncbi:MAG TPA: MarR family transcriptional regulator [Chromatiales bacterium]|nr:MarR family transcriptional regulator [Chromatiales bacterium]